MADPDQSGWADLPGRIGPTGLSTTRHAVASILTVPCFAQMRDDEVAAVCDALRGFPG